MNNLQFIFQKKSISKLLIFLLIINSFLLTDGLFNHAYANPAINEMNINATDTEVSVYGTGNGNGTNLAEKPFRYTIGSSQSEWVRDSSNMTITDTLTAGTLSNTSVVNNALQLSTAEGIYLNGYTYKSVITIDHTKIDTSLSNFPLAVYLNSSNFDFTKAKSDGTDIRFTDANLNPLKFEREEHSALNAKAVYNVLMPSISNTADTVFYMWYGNSNAYNTSIEAWQDQTGKPLNYNGNIMLASGIQSDKRVANFNGTGGYFSIADSEDWNFASEDFTIEIKLNFSEALVNGAYYLLGQASDSNNLFYLRKNDDTNMKWRLAVVSGGNVILDLKVGADSTNPVIGQVCDIAFVRYGNVFSVYKDGALLGSTTANITMPNLTGSMVIGKNPIGTNAPYKGYLYGARITKGTARYTANYVPPVLFNTDNSDVVYCTNFDTIYDQNYVMVQHMGDNFIDATGSRHNGSVTGTTVMNTELGKARSFDGVNDYIAYDSNLAINNFPLTILSFAALPSGAPRSLFHIKGDNSASDYTGASFSTQITGDLYVRFGDGTNKGPSDRKDYKSTTPIILDNSPHCAIAKCVDFNTVNFTVDGVIYPSAYYGGTATSVNFSLAKYQSMHDTIDAQFSQGYNYELRISDIARSDSWNKAESLSLKNELLNYLSYSPSGTRESSIYDVSGYVSGTRVQWTEIKPAGTNIVVEANVSLDGGSSWLGWKPCTNGGSIADLSPSSNTSNARLKLRQTLSTSSGTVTPSISNSVITINFSKYIHRIAAEPNKEYNVKFEVKDANGTVKSETRKVYSKAQLPEFTISDSTTNSVDLLFTDANPSSTEYQIMCDSSYVNSSGVLTSIPTWITLKNKSTTVLGLNIGTMYNFTAKARNTAEEETNYASPIYTGTQGIPVPSGSAILAATALNNSVTLGWDEIPNSLSYELELDGTIKNVGLRTDYLHKDLITSTQHTYRVRGKNLGGYSEWSELLIVNTTNNLPLIPTNVVGKASNHSVSVYWTSVQDALTYTVEIDGTQISEVSKNSACLFGLEPETTYTYKVKACNLTGESEWSEIGSINTTFLSAPKITYKEKDSNQIKIGWEKIEGATSYQIALDSDENFETLYATDLEDFATSSSITYTHDNLPIKTAHVYRVRAICGEGVSAWSDSVTLETLAQRPDVPANFRGNASDNFITLTWDAVQDALGYDLEVDGIVIENDDTPQYLYKGLDQYTEHTYRVRSVTREIQSYWSDMLKIWTLGGIPDEPKNVVISNSRGITTLDWDSTPGAQNYDIEVGGNIYSISEDTFVYNNIDFIDNSTSIYKETAYRIRAGNDLGKSDWTGYYVNNAIMGKVEKGKALDLGLTASNIMDFSRYTLYVNYNYKALTVTDLCSYSVEKELAPGMVEGHDIEIVRFEPGHIVFRVNKIVDEGYLWTGIINNIKFIGNATGGTTLTYTAECSKD